jgi:hypothetical protein
VWWTYAGGRINHTLKYALEVSQGWKVVAENFFVKIAGDGVNHTSSRRRCASSCSARLLDWRSAAMATADQVKALIRSHADGDDTRFYAIAMQVAAQAARSGHGKFAQELRELVDQVKARAKRSSRPGSQAGSAGPAPRRARGLCSRWATRRRAWPTWPSPRLSALASTRVTEQRERDRLREHGFSPMRKLLLVGPPGTGKTMTAAALAGELGLPLFSIQLDGLITKYMGETAAKLRLVFDAIQSTRGVYLFDEFDALGGERGQERRRRDPPRAQLVPAVPRAGRLRQHRARRDEPRRSARPRALPALRCGARVRR